MAMLGKRPHGADEASDDQVEVYRNRQHKRSKGTLPRDEGSEDEPTEQYTSSVVELQDAAICVKDGERRDEGLVIPKRLSLRHRSFLRAMSEDWGHGTVDVLKCRLCCPDAGFRNWEDFKPSVRSWGQQGPRVGPTTGLQPRPQRLSTINPRWWDMERGSSWPRTQTKFTINPHWDQVSRGY
jgi:hypothetical protein